MIDVPSWLWNRNPQGLFEEAGLRVRMDKPGVFLVRTDEAYHHRTPDLIWSQPLYTGPDSNRLGRLTEMKERATVELDYKRIQGHLDRLASKTALPNQLVHIFNYVQAVLVATPTVDLERNVADVLTSLVGIGWEGDGDTDSGPFSTPGLALIRTSTSLHPRLRLPSVFLRLANDPVLAAGEVGHLDLTEGMLFPSSHGLYEGVYLLDPYIGPMRGSMSPSLWSLAGPRTFGTLVVLLGRAIAGTAGDAAEPLQTIMVKGPKRGHHVPEHGLHDQLEAVNWWATALNHLFGVLSDPAMFSTRDGRYDPTRQLGAILTIEQLFRRVTSLLVQHRDSTSQYALLFTSLDSLEGLTGRSLLSQFEHSQASKCMARIRTSMPAAAQKVLLPCAERAETALHQVQEGFTMARQRGETGLLWGEKNASFERAAANYMVALRNSTHGHGGDKGTIEQRERDATLLIQHNGELPDDLPLLAYLYLLDLLSDPERLAKIMRNRASR